MWSSRTKDFLYKVEILCDIKRFKNPLLTASTDQIIMVCQSRSPPFKLNLISTLQRIRVDSMGNWLQMYTSFYDVIISVSENCQQLRILPHFFYSPRLCDWMYLQIYYASLPLPPPPSLLLALYSLSTISFIIFNFFLCLSAYSILNLLKANKVCRNYPPVLQKDWTVLF